MSDDALYVRDGDAFVASAVTVGGWSPDSQSGGAVLALLGHVLEDVPTLVPMSLTRLTVDLVRPVPIGKRMRVDPIVIREGKKVQVVDFTVISDGAERVRARALRVRDADFRDVDGAPTSTTDDDPAAALPPPDRLDGLEDHGGVAEFLRSGMDFRRTDAAIHGVHGIWTRLRLPIVAGEPVRATSRVTVPMDLVNLIGVDFDPRLLTAINPDVSAHVSRPPVGEWVALVGDTRFSHEVGHGVSVATLSDTQGVLGVTSTSQLLDVPPPRVTRPGPSGSG